MPPEWQTQDQHKWITWKHANRKLETETVYWISTATKTGKPHAAPIWGIWKKTTSCILKQIQNLRRAETLPAILESSSTSRTEWTRSS